MSGRNPSESPFQRGSFSLFRDGFHQLSGDRQVVVASRGGQASLSQARQHVGVEPLRIGVVRAEGEEGLLGHTLLLGPGLELLEPQDTVTTTRPGPAILEGTPGPRRRPPGGTAGRSRCPTIRQPWCQGFCQGDTFCRPGQSPRQAGPATRLLKDRSRRLRSRRAPQPPIPRGTGCTDQRPPPAHADGASEFRGNVGVGCVEITGPCGTWPAGPRSPAPRPHAALPTAPVPRSGRTASRTNR